MNRKKTLRSITAFLTQLAAWGILICTPPFIYYFADSHPNNAKDLLHILFSGMLPSMAVYFVNYYLLIPHLFFKERKLWFIVVNLALFLMCNAQLFIGLYYGSIAESNLILGMFAGLTISTMMEIGALGVAIAVRNYMRTVAIRQQLAEETGRRMEAELLWLKHQINPHFLFNSLNNISSLIYIDADEAQDCIGRLSDLLRYAIYESDKKSVRLDREIEFMRNYIALMSIRCNDKTSIDSFFEVGDRQAQVTPLLLISLIENAFKHGVSTSRPSFVKIQLYEADGTLTFICENSDHNKPGTDNSGSGIGIANMGKRLELIYPGRYTWQQDNDGHLFRVRLTIRLNP